MKKIVFVIPTMRMGGAEQSLVSLLNCMDCNKYDIDLILFDSNGILRKNIPNWVNVIEPNEVLSAMTLEFRYFFKPLLKKGHLLAAMARVIMLINSSLQAKLKRNLIFNWSIARYFIKKNNREYDVAIGYLEGVADFYVIDKITAKRKIGWVHTDVSKQKLDLNNNYKYYSAFDKICIISEECRQSFVDKYSDLADKVEVVENISNRSIITKKAEMSVEPEFINENNRIVTVGRLEEVKGIDIAINAAEILNKKGLDFKWHVYGDGSKKKELEELIESKALKDRFVLEGTTENPYAYMKKADILVQPSRREGKSIVLDETKILEKPIVVTNYPSVKDQIEDGVTGVIVDISADAVAEGVEKLIYNDVLRKRLSENCSKLLDNTDEIIGKIEKIING